MNIKALLQTHIFENLSLLLLSTLKAGITSSQMVHYISPRTNTSLKKSLLKIKIIYICVLAEVKGRGREEETEQVYRHMQ